MKGCGTLQNRPALRSIDIKIIGGRYGLGSKDTQPGDIVAVFDNLASKEPKQRFTVSIDDDVTNLSIKALSHLWHQGLRSS